jgi:hypothetical protein
MAIINNNKRTVTRTVLIMTIIVLSILFFYVIHITSTSTKTMINMFLFKTKINELGQSNLVSIDDDSLPRSSSSSSSSIRSTVTEAVMRNNRDNSSFGCVLFENAKFIREMCLIDVKIIHRGDQDDDEEHITTTTTTTTFVDSTAIIDDSSSKYKKLKAKLTVRKRSKSKNNNAVSDLFEWSCGDSVRISFATSDALFAPTNVLEEEDIDNNNNEKICGEFNVEAIIPKEGRQNEGISAKVWLLHVNGEGLKNPLKDKSFPENLISKNNNCPPCDGPVIYNLRRTFPGRVFVEEERYFVNENVEEDEGVGNPILDDAAGYNAAYRSILEQGDGSVKEEWYKIESNKEVIKDPMTELVWRKENRKLEFCKNGDVPGRWVYSKKMYRTQSETEALEWRYYGCKIKHITGNRLKRCLDKIGPTKFAGESTLGHIYEAFLQHMNKTEYFWPQRHDLDARKVYADYALLRAQGEREASSDYHGMTMVNKNLFNELRLHKDRENLKFQNVVILQGANDAARHSIEAFREKMKQFIEDVIKFNKTPNESEQFKLKRLVWVTAPTRHYKAGSGPGDAMCPEGSSIEGMQTCIVNNGNIETSTAAFRYHGVQNGKEASVPPNLFGTHERRQIVNSIAKKMIKEHEKDLADEVYVVDFEAITAALPSDFNYDGEHWGCPWRSWENRRGAPYSCRGLANVVVSNIIAHFLGCSGNI